MTNTRTQEMTHFFMIMSGLAVAKASNDQAAVGEWIDELDAMAMHGSPVFALRGAYEAKQAKEWMKAEALGLPTVLHFGNVAPLGVAVPLN